jgi:hypothetical protein
MPRNTSLTPALQQAIVQAVSGGVPYYQACLLAGVKTSTATEWLARGEGRDPDRRQTPALATFAAAIARAKAQDEARRLLRINQAGQGGAVVTRKTTTYPDGRIVTQEEYAPPDWRADSWHLEHCYPDRYMRKVQADLRLRIEAMAQEVAAEIGVDAQLILAEAQSFLREHDRRMR